MREQETSDGGALRLEKTLLLTSIILFLSAMVAVGMQREEESFVIDVIFVPLTMVFAGIVAWKATTSLNDGYLVRIIWLMGVLVPITSALALAALYDRCNRKISRAARALER